MKKWNLSPLATAGGIAMLALALVLAVANGLSDTSNGVLAQSGYSIVEVTSVAGGDCAACSQPMTVTVRNTDMLDSCTIDPRSVYFGGARASCSVCKDINGDGKMELVLQFCCGTVKAGPDGNAALTALTYSGAYLQGSAAVPVCLPPK